MGKAFPLLKIQVKVIKKIFQGFLQGSLLRERKIQPKEMTLAFSANPK